MNIAQKIKIIAKEKNIKIKDLTNNIGLSRNILDVWNMRNSNPDVYILYNIAKYLGCRIEDILNLPYLE